MKEMGFDFTIMPALGDEIIDSEWALPEIPEKLAIQKTEEVIGRLDYERLSRWC